ncbi:hypothetical protein FisN_2Lh580 [Fistulifera solaris]|uniref:Uncharacterized protein n=1 Tax=Fistulifera solaris TaxID=1519565 RepID=A0A1Z5K8Y3_FISSO|nr:hypothetical protein FisN_2Lh580 [Fistulifera solaris]|eukprot:GAX22743.1 hypothetical protein FisN_2Lh580 [Fistulifera solaris]
MTTFMECIQACPAKCGVLVVLEALIFFLCFYKRGQLVSDANKITGETQNSPLPSTPRKAELQTVFSGSVPAVAPAVADATAQVGETEPETVSAVSVPAVALDAANATDPVGKAVSFENVPALSADVAKAPDSAVSGVIPETPEAPEIPKTPHQPTEPADQDTMGSIVRNGRRSSLRLTNHCEGPKACLFSNPSNQ